MADRLVTNYRLRFPEWISFPEFVIPCDDRQISYLRQAVITRSIWESLTRDSVSFQRRISDLVMNILRIPFTASSHLPDQNCVSVFGVQYAQRDAPHCTPCTHEQKQLLLARVCVLQRKQFHMITNSVMCLDCCWIVSIICDQKTIRVWKVVAQKYGVFKSETFRFTLRLVGTNIGP